jgi:hypothetical protein
MFSQSHWLKVRGRLVEEDAWVMEKHMSRALIEKHRPKRRKGGKRR